MIVFNYVRVRELPHKRAKAAFAEVIAIVALTTITNNVYHNGHFEIDFPKAQHLEQLQDV